MQFSFSQRMGAGCSGLLQDTQQSCFVPRVIKHEGLEEEAVHIGLGTLGFCQKRGYLRRYDMPAASTTQQPANSVPVEKTPKSLCLSSATV